MFLFLMDRVSPCPIDCYKHTIFEPYHQTENDFYFQSHFHGEKFLKKSFIRPHPYPLPPYVYGRRQG